MSQKRATDESTQQIIDRLKEAGDWEAAARLYDLRKQVTCMNHVIGRLQDEVRTLMLEVASLDQMLN